MLPQSPLYVQRKSTPTHPSLVEVTTPSLPLPVPIPRGLLVPSSTGRPAPFDPLRPHDEHFLHLILLLMESAVVERNTAEWSALFLLKRTKRTKIGDGRAIPLPWHRLLTSTTGPHASLGSPAGFDGVVLLLPSGLAFPCSTSFLALRLKRRSAGPGFNRGVMSDTMTNEHRGTAPGVNGLTFAVLTERPCPWPCGADQGPERHSLCSDSHKTVHKRAVSKQMRE